MPCLARLTKLSCDRQTQHAQIIVRDEWRELTMVVVVVVDSIAMGDAAVYGWASICGIVPPA